MREEVPEESVVGDVVVGVGVFPVVEAEVVFAPRAETMARK